MENWIKELHEIFNIHNILKFGSVVTIFVLGIILAKIISRYLAKVSVRSLDLHQAMIIKKLSYNLLIILTLITTLRQLGFDLSVVLGATGLITVAVGFAAQTSFANLISGIFLIVEKPFMIGDSIKIKDITGEVSSIGWFSTLLKTPDNVMVRFPNEVLMKSELSNMTRFSTRRLDIKFLVPQRSPMRELRAKILEKCKSTPKVLQTPGPEVSFVSFDQANVTLLVSTWCSRDDATPLGFEISSLLMTTFEELKIPMIVANADVKKA